MCEFLSQILHRYIECAVFLSLSLSLIFFDIGFYFLFIEILSFSLHLFDCSCLPAFVLFGWKKYFSSMWQTVFYVIGHAVKYHYHRTLSCMYKATSIYIFKSIIIQVRARAHIHSYRHTYMNIEHNNNNNSKTVHVSFHMNRSKCIRILYLYVWVLNCNYWWPIYCILGCVCVWAVIKKYQKYHHDFFCVFL